MINCEIKQYVFVYLFVSFLFHSILICFFFVSRFMQRKHRNMITRFDVAR